MCGKHSRWPAGRSAKEEMVVVVKERDEGDRIWGLPVVMESM